MSPSRVKHIALIGMPTAGKTKVGKKLAELAKRDFVDIDDCIVKRCGATKLQEIVDKLSPADFAALEQSVAIQTVNTLSSPTIIATGGSMIYHQKAMERIRREARIIFLEASFETIQRRIAKKPDRGIVFAPGESLFELFKRREPLYKQWAQKIVNCDGRRSEVAHRLAQDLGR